MDRVPGMDLPESSAADRNRRYPDRFSSETDSGEPECLPLLRPGERQTRMLEKHSRGQIGQLTVLEDRAGDVGGEIGQADDPGIVGSVELLAPGELGESPAGTLQQPRFEQMRPDDQLDQARVRSRRKGVTPLDPQVIEPGDVGYDTARRVWNASIGGLF
jgi:hypothetical protein